jgi:hypothetical protein
MKQRVKDVIPIFETQVDITIVEEKGSYYIYMDHEFIEEVNNRGHITMWHFDKKGCHSFDFSTVDLVEEKKFKISKRTVDKEKYPVNTPFPIYRGFQRPPPTF